jgi:hypothetical protein
MPKLHKKKGKDEYYVQTSISGQVITYQLTRAGQQKLLDIGLGHESPFGRRLLLSLIPSGDAFTHGTGLRPSPKSDQQLELDFDDDPCPEKALPACSECSSPENLHLITTASHAVVKYDAYLLCASCREKNTVERDVSIPITLVSRPVFYRLQDWKLIQNPEPRVKAYRDLLDTDYEKMWEEERKRKGQPKTGLLPMEGESQSKLFT